MMWKSFSKCYNQKSSLVVAAKALYSTSANDQETIVCFLAFQEIKEPARKMQKAVIDLLESLHDSQSASKKAVSHNEEEEERKMPCPGVDLRYRRS